MRTISVFLAGFVPPLAGFVIHPILGIAIIVIDIFIIIFWDEVYDALGL